MSTGVLIMAGVAGTVVLFLLVIFRRDAVDVDLSGRTLLRLYLYLASVAALIVLAIGLSLTLDRGGALVAGDEFVYGRPPTALPCAPGPSCPDSDQLTRQYTHQRDQRRDESLIAGLTLTLFGAVFWAGHRVGLRVLGLAEERASGLRRAYVALGMFVFGAAALVLLPVGAYQALSAALLRPGPDVYKQGVEGTLSGGIVALPLWLGYLRTLARDLRAPK